jgi:gliding motility-associated protein GldM
MGHGKETPRQKMIGMMYLVLTALLAMNVQKEVLDAFINVDEGLNKTISNFAARNQVIYDDFDDKAMANPEKVGPLKEQAAEVKKRADELYFLIQDMKKEIVTISEGAETPAIDGDLIHVKEIKGKDNMDIPAQVMIGDNNDKRGKELRNALNGYRDFLLSLIDEKDEDIRHSIETSLETEDHIGHDGHKHPWESHNFEHLPLAGVIAIMSGIQTDVRNSESEVINYLYGQIDAGSFKFNRLEATVIPNSNYILKGNEYNAQIFLAASDTTQDPIIYLGDYDSTYNEATKTWTYEMVGSYDSIPVRQGKGVFSQRGQSIGNKSYKGIIKLQNLDGSYTTRPFHASYQVAEGSAGVNPLKMNVFYLGVDNPVDVFVSGVPSENVSASVDNGTIRRRPNGTWVVNPRYVGNAFVTVKANVDGTSQSFGYKEFRVKQVPDPVAKIAGMSSGVIPKATLMAQAGIIADMENFDFDLEFKVTQFTTSATIKGFTQDVKSNNNLFNPKQKDLIQKLSRGDRVYFEDIKAIGPDGVERPLNAIVFKIN